jgi:hypothetical protein
LNDLSFHAKRALTGVLAIPCFLVIVNHFFDLGIFDKYSREAMVSWAVLWAILRFVGPTVRETQEYKALKRATNDATTTREQGGLSKQ